MSKHIARTLTLALTLLALAPAALANQTGGDPEPMPPGIIHVILTILQLA
jgi:heme A synthase